MPKILVLLVIIFFNICHLAQGQCTDGYYVEGSGTIVICGKGIFSFDTLRFIQPTGTAIRIDTEDTVMIRNTVIISRANFIVSPYVYKANLTVENCTALPYTKEIEAQPKGHFIWLDRFKSVIIRNNYMEYTRGILLHGQFEDQTYEDIIVQKNKALNIDGRIKRNNKIVEELSCFVQISGVKKAKNAVISWNEAINEPYKSWVRDVINIYNSNGMPDSPILVANNYIQGAFSFHVLRARPNYCDNSSNYLQDGFYGGGIMLGDGGIIINGKLDTTQASAYLVAKDNQVINTSNYGIAISSGHDISFYNNTILSSGKVNGYPVLSNNIGAYIANLYGNLNLHPDSCFYRNSAYNNSIGYVRNVIHLPNGDCGDVAPQRSDFWFPHGYNCHDNRSYVPDHLAAIITEAMEKEEYDKWQQKLAMHQIHLGPTEIP